ncbi:MAG TPA: TMEM175 family protein [Terriglobales bacterium]
MSSETSRVEAFSDGVYAVAITLLIFNIHVPPSEAAGRLGAALIAQWPAYVAFLISFAFIGIMWVNHHRLFNHIRRSDNRLLFLNLLLLLGVTVVPFPTALLAAHYNAADRTIATAVFNGTYFAIAIFFNVLWHHAVRAGLLDSATLESANAISKQYAIGPAAYLVCLILTWISAPASLLLNIALAVFFAIPPRVASGKNHFRMRSATK